MSGMVDQLRLHAEHTPDTTALIVLGVGGSAREISYAELSRRTDRIAWHFAKRFVEPAIVPLMADKNADVVAAMFALLASGHAFAALNRKLKAPQIENILRQIDPAISLMDRQTLSALGESGVTGARADVFRVAMRSAESVGCCLFTSGSTGTPKGVLISEPDLCARAAAEAECFRLTHRDVLLCVLPFSFDVGLNQLMSAIFAGCTLVLSDSWLPADILRTTERFGVTGISAVPAIWNDLLNARLQFDASKHRSLRYITVSGGDLPLDRLKQLQNAIGDAGIIKTYGQSETFRSTALLPDEFAQKPESVGKAFPGGGSISSGPMERARTNEPGEIVHSGLGTMLKYLDGENPNLRSNPCYGSNDPSTRAVFTGDIGWLDEDGFLFVQGRRDSMLKIAGNRVYPQEIISQLLLLPGIANAEIVAQKDAAGETQITAFVVAQVEATLDPNELRREIMRRLPSYMVPRQIVVLDELPRTASGKIDRLALGTRR